MVRVEDDRIAEVGSRVTVPAGARVIDLGDATLLPGLIDLHTHLTDKFGVTGSRRSSRPRPARPRSGARPTRARP
jgi:imidazolonepropionase-like amidohydrolase